MRKFIIGAWKAEAIDGATWNSADIPAGVGIPTGIYGDPATGIMAGLAEAKTDIDIPGATVVYDELTADERPDDTEAAALRTQLQARGLRAAQLNAIDAKEEVVTRQRVPEVRDLETGEVITPEVPEVRQTLHATRRERAERIIDQLTNRIR